MRSRLLTTPLECARHVRGRRPPQGLPPAHGRIRRSRVFEMFERSGSLVPSFVRSSLPNRLPSSGRSSERRRRGPGPQVRSPVDSWARILERGRRHQAVAGNTPQRQQTTATAASPQGRDGTGRRGPHLCHGLPGGFPPAPEAIKPSPWFLRMPVLHGPPQVLGLT